MKIEKSGDEKIVVALTNKDLNELDITYDEMDYSNIETRRVIWTILDEACRELGEPIDTDSRLLIEVSPDEDGGCTMYFTSVPTGEFHTQKRLVMKKDTEPLVFDTADSDAFLDAFSLLKKQTEKLKNVEPYILDNRFCLIITPAPTFSPYLTYILKDFGDVETGNKTAISEIYEYGKSIKSVI